MQQQQWQQPIHPKTDSTHRKVVIASLVFFGIIVGVIAWLGYQAYQFYDENVAGLVEAFQNGEMASTNPEKVAAQMAKIGFASIPEGYTPLYGMHVDVMGEEMAQILLVPTEERAGLMNGVPHADMPDDLPADVQIELEDYDDPDPTKMNMIVVSLQSISEDDGLKTSAGGSIARLQADSDLLSRKSFELKINGMARSGLREKRNLQGAQVDYYLVGVTDQLKVQAAGPWGQFDRKPLLKFLRSYRTPARPSK